MKIRFVTPQTLDELLQYYDDIEFMHYFVPYSLRRGDLKEFLSQVVSCFTLVFLNELPIGCFTLYPVQGESKRALEVHGIARPDLKRLIGKQPAVKVLKAVYQRMFYDVFVTAGKDKLIAKIPPNAHGALNFVRRHGFKQVPNMEKGRTIWKLDRETYEERNKNVLRETKNQNS